MKCPVCGHEELAPPTPCPECGFSGSLPEIEELAHIQYLLHELAEWQDIPPSVRDRLQKQYARQQWELEVALELRPPPLTPQEARQALKERLRLRQLLHLLDHWVERGWVSSDGADDLAARSRKRIEELRARLVRSEEHT
ncbi:MAG: hypothetical protein KKC18_05705, partial [Chloroflexi bacterium]|nr:hypothetical protein [Chloroflexota bacterium]